MLREAFGLFKCGRILGFLDSATVECNMPDNGWQPNFEIVQVLSWHPKFSLVSGFTCTGAFLSVTEFQAKCKGCWLLGNFRDKLEQIFVTLVWPCSLASAVLPVIVMVVRIEQSWSILTICDS
jgi:hypothetical protein